MGLDTPRALLGRPEDDVLEPSARWLEIDVTWV